MLTDTRDLARKLAALEQDLKGRLDIHEAAIVDVLQRIMKVLDPPPLPLEPPPAEIGFHVKEDAIPYRVKKKKAGQQVGAEIRRGHKQSLACFPPPSSTPPSTSREKSRARPTNNRRAPGR